MRRLRFGALIAALLWSGGAYAQDIRTTLPQALAPASSPTFTGLTLSNMTQGSVLFAGAGGVLSQDNANFFWDATNHRLGIRNTTPQAALTVGTTAATARSYNSFTDASNGEWAYMGDWGLTSNVATYGTDKNGTGVARGVQILSGGAVALKFGVSGDGVNNTASGVYALFSNTIDLEAPLIGAVMGELQTAGILTTVRVAAITAPNATAAVP